MKESFVFFETWAEAIRQMPDKERLQIYDAIMAYGIYGAKTELGGLAQMALNLVYNDIDDCKTKRAERAEKNRENIRKRWNKNNTIVYDGIQNIPTNTKDTVDVNVNVNGDVNVNGNVNDNVDNSMCVEKSTPQTKPTKSIEERENVFMQLVADNGKNIYPDEMLQAFFDYWTEKSQNGKKMHFEMQKTFDVKKRLATWARNENKFKSNYNGINNGASTGSIQERAARIAEYAFAANGM